MTRVLVVDDSPSVRELLVHILASDPEIEVVGAAQDGDEAVRMAGELLPDVITMDLQMPNMDGVEATRRIMQTCPAPIVIVSGLQDDPVRVDASFRAIEAGALVIARRPLGLNHASYRSSADDLIRTVKSMAEVKVVRRWAIRQRPVAGPSRALGANGELLKLSERRLVLIGASTGGPAVLREILSGLSPTHPFSIMVVQHMAVGFMTSFGEWLANATGLAITIAAEGMQLKPAQVYLAPDGFQVALGRDLRVSLTRAPLEHGMAPSVSHLFRMLDASLCRKAVAILLTGMGKDGGEGLKWLKDNGAMTIVQDRASAVVYGMPGEAIRLDAAMHVLTPTEIARTLQRLANE